MADCREAFDDQNQELARRLIEEGTSIEDHCDEQIARLVRQQDIALSTTYALAYRYFKRVGSHVVNVATSIVQPLDKIDFSEKPNALDVE